MEKRNLILAGLMSALCFPAAVNAAEITVCADGCTYTDLNSAVVGAAEDDTIKLTENLTVNSTISVDKSVTIDLNGHDITAGSGLQYVLLFNLEDGEFYVTDSSNDTAGSIINSNTTDGRGIKVENGILTIDRVTVSTYDRAIQINPVAESDVAKVVINGGTYKTSRADSKTRTILLWGNGKDGASSLVVNDGTITSPFTALESSAIGVGGTSTDGQGGVEATINDGTISGLNGIRVMATESNKAILTVNGGTITATNSGIVQANDNTVITINGGTITSAKQAGIDNVNGDSVAIQHSHNGVLVIGKEDGTGPTLTGETAVAIKAGDITVQGGKIIATGEYREKVIEYQDGTDDSGAAISITSNEAYTGGVKLKITGGTLVSNNGNALFEGIAYDVAGDPTATESSVTSMSVTGGSFDSAKDSVVATYAEKFITAGTFSSDVTEYVSDEVNLSQDENGNYVVGSDENLGDSEVPTTPEETPTTPEEVPETPQTYDGSVVSIMIGAGALAVVVAAVVLAKKRILFN